MTATCREKGRQVWRRPAGKRVGRYRFVALEVSFTLREFTVLYILPVRFLLRDSHEVQLFQLVRKRKKTKDK